MFIDIKKIEKLIAGQDVAFISSIDEDGYPNTKAMLKPRQRDGIKIFYFSTNTSSLRVDQYRKDPKACLYFYHKGLINYQGVMLKGTMEVLEDMAIKKALWKMGDQMFYPKGVTDPDYCVLKFTAVQGRYYNNLKTENFSLA